MISLTFFGLDLWHELTLKRIPSFILTWILFLSIPVNMNTCPLVGDEWNLLLDKLIFSLVARVENLKF